jgi:hypothetical protein
MALIQATRVIHNGMYVSTPRTGVRRRFFFALSLVLLVVAFTGFAPSYYLSSVITIPGAPEQPPLPGYVILHGATMTLWLLLLMAQTALVARGRRDIHRKLGIAGVVLALAIVPLGWMTIELSASRASTTFGKSPTELIEQFHLDAALLRGVIGLAVFAGCVLVAVLRRRNAATHGRLMLLASVAATSAALAPTRLIGALTGPLLPSWLLVESVYAVAIVAALAFYDWRRLRRIHPVTLVVGALLVLVVPIAAALAATDAGHAWFMGLFPQGA